MDGMSPGVLAFVWILCGFVALGIADRKDAAVHGFLLGLAFGPLGILIACFVEGRTRCPYCREHVYRNAKYCPHCYNSLYWVSGDAYGNRHAASVREEQERANAANWQAAGRMVGVGIRTTQTVISRWGKEFNEWLKGGLSKLAVFGTQAAVASYRKIDGVLESIAGNSAVLKWFYRGLLATALVIPVVWWAQSPSNSRESSAPASAEARGSIENIASVFGFHHKEATPSQVSSPVRQPMQVRTLFPGSRLDQISSLTFQGRRPGDRNEIGNLSINGEFRESGEVLTMGKGSSAAIMLQKQAADAYAAISGDLAGTGNIFFLLGWSDGSGYLLYNMSLRTQGYWRLIYIENGKAVPETFQQLSPFRMINPGRLVVEVVNGKLTTWFEGQGKTIMAQEIDLPNYRPGAFIFGTAPNQYGPKKLKIRKIETSGRASTTQPD